MYLDEYRATPFTELGLNVQNLLGVAWELTHFSFVVDRFVNIGDVIYANLPRAGVTPLGGCTTTVDHIRSFFWCSAYASTSPAVVTTSGVPGDTLLCERIEKSRFVDRNRSGSKLVIRDDFHPENWKWAADYITLLIQQMQGMKFFK
jgi:hypothetical protein